jgi:DNA-binding MarR family transcriptional regulator
MSELSEHGVALSGLVVEVFRLNGVVLEAGNALTQPAGLTSARWQVLGVVDHAPAAVATVARAMGLTRQSVQQTADAMARDGFVEYVENPHHQRANLISITPRGRKALAEVERRHATWANRLGARMSAGRLRTLAKGLAELRTYLEEEVPPVK